MILKLLHRHLQTIVVFAGSLFAFLMITYVALVYAEHGAWIIIFSIGFLCALATGLYVKSTALKLVLFHVGAALFAFAIFESFLEYTFQKTFFGGKMVNEGGCYEPGYYDSHPFLGYGPGKDGEYSCIKYINDELVYDVTYTRKNGLRVVPASNQYSQDAAIFLGCSFTFGEGLGDHATIPNQFNLHSGGQYNVKNYGFHGYGPHQMLKNIKQKVRSDIEGMDGNHVAFYTFIPDHIKRAAGKTKWDRSGPRFEIENDELVYKGSFNFQSPEYFGQSNTVRRVLTALQKSRIYYQVFIARDVNQKDLDRTIAIISRSNQLLSEMGVDFHVAVWDLYHIGYAFHTQDDFDYFIEQLEKENISMLKISSLIDSERILDYTLHQHDAHPNEKATELIARELRALSLGIGSASHIYTDSLIP